ncbi:CPBP family glutamic-type intramembrane protease [Ancylomarina longa]|uniref:CPBP family intramembrane metalloprotease n=1 Tax=Ancylomarina longa TaxID=2487017 RepID=A0A434AUH2_9BACT|nr:CPBP family glutamic-type intramembrane protease [Ancylomarina longa]RUT78077.1 CPBP family intramembrane metalloprotease [Ancylomarina longa]
MNPIIAYFIKARSFIFIFGFLSLIVLVDLTAVFLPETWFINPGVEMSFREFGTVFTVITGVFIDPIIETYIFQIGIIFLVRKVINRPRYNLLPAILSSAIVFGWIHDNSIAYMVYAFLIGLILAFATYIAIYKRRAFWLVICIHSMQNLIAFLINSAL